MLARAVLPLRYQLFNWRWGAPSGRLVRGLMPPAKRTNPVLAPLVGPFGFQANNTTRAFEYPWAFEALDPGPGVRVLEIGGGLSGLQFTLDRAGCSVVNVDPGDTVFNPVWPVTQPTIDTLNRLFGTQCTLLNSFLEDVHFADCSFDRVVSVSVFEHLTEAALASLLAEVRRVLKPGGTLVATIDLFLDVHPFSMARDNTYGHNVSVRWLVETSGLELVFGNRAELFGFPEFLWDDIKKRQTDYLVGKYPAMAQAIVLRKPA